MQPTDDTCEIDRSGAGRPGTEVITMAGLRDILAERRVFPFLPPTLTDDAEFHLDSMGYIWLFHMIEERYGIDIDPSDAEILELTSIRRIHGFVTGTPLPEKADGR